MSSSSFPILLSSLAISSSYVQLPANSNEQQLQQICQALKASPAVRELQVNGRLYSQAQICMIAQVIEVRILGCLYMHI